MLVQYRQYRVKVRLGAHHHERVYSYTSVNRPQYVDLRIRENALEVSKFLRGVGVKTFRFDILEL